MAERKKPIRKMRKTYEAYTKEINAMAAKILADECGDILGHVTGTRSYLCPKCEEHNSVNSKRTE